MSDAASPVRRRLLQSLAAFAGTMAAACGGGGSVGGVGTGGTGDGAGTTPGAVPDGAAPSDGALPPGNRNATVVGPVTGFGSVFVADVRFDVAGAQISSEDQSGWGADDLKLGMMVQVQGVIDADGASGTATQVRAFGEVRGPVTRIDAAAGSMSVVGAPVVVDARTLFDGAAGLSALRPGDFVEVYGLPGQPGAPIAATRVARVRAPFGGSAPVKTRGVAVDVDPATRRFSVNGLVVSYAAAASVAPALADGVSVVVRADALPALGPVAATRIEVDRLPMPAEGASTRLEGSVGAFRSLSDFKVGGVAVNASAAGVHFIGGAPAALRNGVKAVITGAFRDSILLADTVTVDSASGPQTLEFAGPIESFVSPADFVVRGQRIDASGAGVQFVPGRLGAADLSPGRVVQVRGTLAGGVLAASRVKFDD